MTSLFPDILCDDLAACRDFYCELLGFEVAFENEWYVQLQHPAQRGAQLAFVQRDHPSVPAGFRDAPQGVIVTVELDDVDAVWKRAEERGLEPVLSLRDEPWGQRHFITRDPAGLLLDVVTLIPPSQEYAAGYASQS